MSSERSPLLGEQQNHDEVASIERGQLPDAERDEDTDQPTSWTKQDKIKFSLFTIFIVISFTVTFVAVRKSSNASFDWRNALKQALGGGITGATELAAMLLQVLTLMPLRTIMNVQYRYGHGLRQVTTSLYREGGFARYYSGLGAALFQAPIARFGDAASNVGAFALLDSNPTTRNLPSLAKTFFAAIIAGSFRMVLTPIDTLKTTLQTQGRQGVPILRNRIRKHGIGTLWYGALANLAATIIGYFPWWGTYNYLRDHLPEYDDFKRQLLRQALIGFVSSVVSDTISNFMRVLKTYRQVNATKISYRAAARAVVRADGWSGLFGRGLKTRILANGLQGLMFAVLWKLLLDLWNRHI
ncbi:SubName: Full=Uncharacterized protein {ECO:0000313/EMBL:CCA68673.1} [Serendipita indica DSM 11827]|uniref:Carrier protein n=1 Tax=Serendipita indica (strain DSM 11827) TaxID=1109443 RepID=G4TBI2_SERID|nr:SubName: Full=Uncharacterized protein {ECO:0000313/EMBL:CCA68673.1} [Serendipita indica DSM 11827]CCA68673.1 hypothetical protein PIIN_02538 [Serendipita indica DSM 11827]